jgi:hypothetical protein
VLELEKEPPQLRTPILDQPTIPMRRSVPPIGRHPRRGFTPAVQPLEGRRLLTAAATMTQAATFPDLESHPTLSDQAILYFSATMGTLTEVDLVTSGSFQSQSSAENLGASGCTIAVTTGASLAINVPTGAVPVTIPPITETFNASAFDGKLDYGGTSGKTFAPVTSRSAPQMTVLTSPADLAAFTGHFRIPISVSGHATESVTSSSNDLSTAFQTDTSATITVIYHYIPNLPDPGLPYGSPTSPPSGGAGAGSIQAGSARPGAFSTHLRDHGSSRTRKSSLHRHPHPFLRHGPRQAHHPRHHPRQPHLSRHHGPGSRTHS